MVAGAKKQALSPERRCCERVEEETNRVCTKEVQRGPGYEVE